LALDLAILLLQQSGVSNAALIEAVELAVKDTAEEDYWCQLKMHILSM